MVSSSGTGHSGPDKDYVAYGSLLQYYTGWNSISGYPDGRPIKGGLWADPWVGLELAMVTAAALNHRAVTGEGQYIDYSMAEALTACLPEALLDFQMNGRERPPMANGRCNLRPHEVYRCKGPDRWVAIAVTGGDDGWRSARSSGAPTWPRTRTWRQRRDAARVTTRSTTPSPRGPLSTTITRPCTACSRRRACRTLLEPARLFHDPQLRQGGYFTRQRVNDGTWRDLPASAGGSKAGPVRITRRRRFSARTTTTFTATSWASQRRKSPGSRKNKSSLKRIKRSSTRYDHQYEKRTHVATITIDNPGKGNILDRQTSADIAAAWQEVWDDADVRAVILTGTGDRHFCAGHNLATRPDITLTSASGCAPKTSSGRLPARSTAPR